MCPLSFAREADQFGWSREVVLLSGVMVTAKAHLHAIRPATYPSVGRAPVLLDYFTGRLIRIRPVKAALRS
jgi:hypothetical protein